MNTQDQARREKLTAIEHNILAIFAEKNIAVLFDNLNNLIEAQIHLRNDHTSFYVIYARKHLKLLGTTIANQDEKLAAYQLLCSDLDL